MSAWSAVVGGLAGTLVLTTILRAATELRLTRTDLPFLVGTAVTGVVLIFFAIDTVRNAPETFAAIVGIAVLAVVLDLIWKSVRGPGTGAAPDLGAAGDR